MIAFHDIHIADAAQMRLSPGLERSQLERPRLTLHEDLGAIVASICTVRGSRGTGSPISWNR